MYLLLRPPTREVRRLCRSPFLWPSRPGLGGFASVLQELDWFRHAGAFSPARPPPSITLPLHPNCLDGYLAKNEFGAGFFCESGGYGCRSLQRHHFPPISSTASRPLRFVLRPSFLCLWFVSNLFSFRLRFVSAGQGP